MSANERTPDGIKQHEPGAKLDAGKNRLGLVLGGFSNALKAVGEVGTFGANKYTDNGWMHVNEGIPRYTDAAFRHQLEELSGETIDPETGFLHAAHTAWNSLARLELMIRADIEAGMDQPKPPPATESAWLMVKRKHLAEGDAMLNDEDINEAGEDGSSLQSQLNDAANCLSFLQSLYGHPMPKGFAADLDKATEAANRKLLRIRNKIIERAIS